MADRDVILAKIKEYRSALEENPKAKAFIPLSDALRQIGQLDDALEVALRGTWELPQFAEGYAAVGRVYGQRKVHRKAEEAFQRALSVDQMCISAYKGLARVFHDQGESAKASDILTKAIMLDPDDASLKKMLEALSSSPTQGRAGLQSGETEERETEGKAETTQTAAGMKPITTATIAEIYIEQGLYEKALDVYRELLAERPDDPAVRQKIAELEGLMGAESPVADTNSSRTEPFDQVRAEPEEGMNPREGDAVIDQLNWWLEAIRSRRNRV